MKLINARIIGANVPIERYREQSAKRGERGYVMGRSDLCDFAACPHRWLLGHEDDEDGSDATAWGTLVDAILLSTDAGVSRIAVCPETYPAEGRKGQTEERPWNWNANFCRDWRDAQGDKLVVKPETWAKAEAACKAMRDDPYIAELLRGADFQVMVTAEADVDGVRVPLKTLIDIVPAKVGRYARCLGDLKTTKCAAPYPWARTVNDRRYHVQSALYLDVFNAATGENRAVFLHPVQESDAPYECARRYVSEDFLRLGRAVYQQAIVRYAECLETGNWPGYDEYDGMVVEGWARTEPDPWMLQRAGVNPDAGAEEAMDAISGGPVDGKAGGNP